MNPLPVRTITEAAAAFRESLLTPVELIEACLQRMAAYEPVLHTFRLIMAEEALAAARQTEAELRSGRDRGPLHGIPITIKDNLALSGVPLTNGSVRTPAFIPLTDADALRALKEAGAIVIGKSHLHEFAYGAHHPLYPPVRNPWDLSRLPGGSSSGAAAGLAAGFALGAVGTDTAGSIRVPASFCGVTGFKPTYGRISTAGATPLAPTLDHVGVLAATCTDAALLLDALGQPGKAGGPQRSPGILPASLSGLRLGVPEVFFEEPTEHETADAVLGALKCMEAAGAKLIPVHIEASITELKEATWTILHAEAHQAHESGLQDWKMGYGPALQANLERGRRLSGEAYTQAIIKKNQTYRQLAMLWDQVDVLVTPTCPWSALPEGQAGNGKGAVSGEYTPFANLWGLPAVSVLAGFTTEGLPIGMQISGQRHDDELVLSIGRLYEDMVDWKSMRPEESGWRQGSL